MPHKTTMNFTRLAFFLFVLGGILLTPIFGYTTTHCDSGKKDCNGECIAQERMCCPPEQKECQQQCIPDGDICLNLNYPEFGAFDLNKNQELTQMIAWFYVFIVGISGLAAFVMIVWGGVQWMTSAGNPGQAGDARDKIQKALLGLLIVLASYLILQIINPDLTLLEEPQLPP
jgi:hypothetical protein